LILGQDVLKINAIIRTFRVDSTELLRLCLELTIQPK